MEAQLRSLRLQLDLQAEQLQAELQAARLSGDGGGARRCPCIEGGVAVGRVSPGRSGAVYAAPNVAMHTQLLRRGGFACRYSAWHALCSVYPVVRHNRHRVGVEKECA